MKDRLAQLHKIAKVREQRAVAEAQSRHQLHMAAERACQEAVSVVNGLRQAREDVMTKVWSDQVITGESIQMAIQCAEYLATQQQMAQKKVLSAEAAQAKALSEWEDARSEQAVAMRSTFKLGKALDAHLVTQRRTAEQRAATLRDDDGQPIAAKVGSW